VFEGYKTFPVLKDVDRPQPGPGQVLLKVAGSGATPDEPGTRALRRSREMTIEAPRPRRVHPRTGFRHRRRGVRTRGERRQPHPRGQPGDVAEQLAALPADDEELAEAGPEIQAE